MRPSPALDRHDRVLTPHSAATAAFENDERWLMVQRIVASRHFVRSPLLSRFLQHIVAETLAGRAEEITEHQIGVQVFGRPSTYRTVEDNIVRNYARQLRRRLADYFAGEGGDETMHICIPLGGYVPDFVQGRARDPEPPIVGGPVPVRVGQEASDRILSADSSLRRARRFWLFVLLALGGVALALSGWFAALYFAAPAPSVTDGGATAPLWAALFEGPRNTYIVPADAGLNLLEDLSQRPLTLADYVGNGYEQIKLPAVNAHSERDLKTQHFTSFVDLQIISALSRLPEYNPDRTILRFPRDLRIDDLRNANAIILGSVDSNPWAALAAGNANFRIVYRNGMQGATIVNARPEPGERAEYVSHWNDPAHETYALISCLPNLEGNGRLLVLQGLDVAGTQAAAEALFHPETIASILRRARRRDGSLGYFEILLRTTSIESSATRTQVIGSRVY